MNLKEFAEKHKVNTKTDSCADAIILGFFSQKDMPTRQEYRSHIYEHGDGQFGLCLILATARRWEGYKREALAAGFTLKQNAHAEGTLLFNPENEEQAKLALKLARVKKRRVLSPERREQAIKSLRSRQAA